MLRGIFCLLKYVWRSLFLVCLYHPYLCWTNIQTMKYKNKVLAPNVMNFAPNFDGWQYKMLIKECQTERSQKYPHHILWYVVSASPKTSISSIWWWLFSKSKDMTNFMKKWTFTTQCICSVVFTFERRKFEKLKFEKNCKLRRVSAE